MMTGDSRAQKAFLKVTQTARRLKSRVSPLKPSFLLIMKQAIIRATPMAMPGRRPARNRSVMEVPVATP